MLWVQSWHGIDIVHQWKVWSDRCLNERSLKFDRAWSYPIGEINIFFPIQNSSKIGKQIGDREDDLGLKLQYSSADTIM